MEGKKAEELNALEAFLREDDAVMELNILTVLKRYISDRGNPATVVELLSDNYQGDAHACEGQGALCILICREGLGSAASLESTT